MLKLKFSINVIKNNKGAFKMKIKSIVLLMMIIVLFFFGYTFLKSNQELSTGKYVMLNAENEDWAWVLLSDDHQFEFNRHLATSYRPMGTYFVENDKLILKVCEQEIYVFKIEGNRLIFQSSKNISSLVPVGTIFELKKGQ